MAEANQDNNELYTCSVCEKHLRSEKALGKHMKFYQGKCFPPEESESRKRPRIEILCKDQDKNETMLNEDNLDQMSTCEKPSPSSFKKEQISGDVGNSDEESSSKELPVFNLAEKHQILKAHLSHNYSRYISALKRLLQGDIDKERFYEETYSFFTKETINANNEFLRAFFAEIYADSKASSSSTNCSHSWSHTRGIRYCKNCNMRDTNIHFSSVQGHQRDPEAESSFSEELASTLSTKVINFEHASTKGYLRPVEAAYHGDGVREHSSKLACLPDIETMYGLIYITAWERGLNIVDRLALPVMTAAVEIHLKRIVTAILMRRNAYKMQPPSSSGKENDEAYNK
ncbi:uncharacterized protein LOC118201494 [Stegodyphus dumicola]|uniref:uncharacterized protein LOC118201494 n=1 Tax=Stegodyphus dumicola TaxID=202533 RepID=UPI0015A8B5A9|nr:uncharacterized protein LOC118201494 [Stegodyphus dumicola]